MVKNHKLIAAALALLSPFALGAGNDLRIEQRLPDNSQWIQRLVSSPPTGTGAILGYSPTTAQPFFFSVGKGLTLSSGALIALPPSWADVSGKPELASVATSGNYADLSGKPSIPAPQVRSDWQASEGVSSIANKPVLSTVATSGAYADLTGKPSTFAPAPHTHAASDVTSGVLALARIPQLPIGSVSGLQSALDGKMGVLSGTSAQYLRGDGSLASFPAIPAAQVNSDWNSASGAAQILNKPALSAVATSGAYADLSGRPSIPAAQVNSDWNSTSGASQILNKPSSFAPSPHTHAIADVTGLQASLNGKLNTPTGSQSQYVRGDGSLAELPTSPAPTFGATPARALNTAFQVSPTRNAHVAYGVDVTVTALLVGGSRGTVTLQYADNAAMTANVVTVLSGTSSVGGVLNVSAIQTVVLTGWIPAGKYVRIVTANTAGTPTFAYNSGTEALF